MAESPKKLRRKTLTELFPGLQIQESTPSKVEPPSPVRRREISSRFKNSVRARYGSDPQVSMTIRMDPVYRTYATGQNPDVLFRKAQEWLTVCQQQCKDIMADLSKQDTLLEALHQMMIEAVFGSNAIERAGLGWNITYDLCRKVFMGDNLGPTPIPEREAEYHDGIVTWLRQKEPELSTKSAVHVLRGRNEVVQHAKAMQHITDVFVVQEKSMTEELLKETHRILVTGVSAHTPEGPVSWESYGGNYRTRVVAAGRTCFVAPPFIAAKMAKFVADLQTEIQQVETSNSVDPVALATKYAMDFVQIHPFLDGNGRMCRLILNAIMFRYTSTMVPIGEHGDEDRNDWLECSSRASNDCTDHGELAVLVLKKWGPKVRRMKKKLAGKRKNKD